MTVTLFELRGCCSTKWSTNTKGYFSTLISAGETLLRSTEEISYVRQCQSCLKNWRFMSKNGFKQNRTHLPGLRGYCGSKKLHAACRRLRNSVPQPPDACMPVLPVRRPEEWQVRKYPATKTQQCPRWAANQELGDRGPAIRGSTALRAVHSWALLTLLRPQRGKRGSSSLATTSCRVCSVAALNRDPAQPGVGLFSR